MLAIFCIECRLFTLNNDNFHVEIDAEEESVEKSVKEIMQRAFWDILKAELEADPPQFNQVALSNRFKLVWKPVY